MPVATRRSASAARRSMECGIDDPVTLHDGAAKLLDLFLVRAGPVHSDGHEKRDGGVREAGGGQLVKQRLDKQSIRAGARGIGHHDRGRARTPGQLAERGRADRSGQRRGHHLLRWPRRADDRLGYQRDIEFRRGLPCHAPAPIGEMNGRVPFHAALPWGACRTGWAKISGPAGTCGAAPVYGPSR
ncbi:MAG: hypothetical protein FD129_778 [bacterium]|nr:MAG: hypothetical protein FD129_778 [bacterium]